MAIFQFLLAGYQNFVSQKSMLKRLYGEEALTIPSRDGLQGEDEKIMGLEKGGEPKEHLRAKLKRRLEFNASYCKYIMVSLLSAFCCCK